MDFLKNMTSNKLFKIILLTLIVISVTNSLFAINLFSPGKLSTYHKDLEGTTNCVKCHSKRGDSRIDDSSCLSCHTEIDKRIKNKEGYHYYAVTIEKNSCASCHREHFGDRYKLVTWPDVKGKKVDCSKDKKRKKECSFDHDLTGYRLEGAHKDIEDCASCHTPINIKDKNLFGDENVNIDRTFLGLDDSCVSCHPNDFHREQITEEDCSKCHNQTDFKDVMEEYDHDNKFKLKGAHKDTSCESCHKPLAREIYQGKWRDRLQHKDLKFENCIDCHKDDDIHKEKFGNNCERCHTEVSFSPKLEDTDKLEWDRDAWVFDINTHAKDDFPLKGKHRDLDCRSCHGNKVDELPESTTCVSCHKKDDPHRNKFGEGCESCHNENSFNDVKDSDVNHDLTGYILKGAHKKESCVSCHKARGTYKERFLDYNEDRGCRSCHTKDNVHKDEFDDRDCSKCHNEDRFTPSEFTIEDHNKLDFKLDGSHNNVSCNQCHKPYKENKKDVLTFNTDEEHNNMKDKSCKDCHENPHIGQFEDIIAKDGCEKCHTTKDFHDELFDHDKDTNFKLVNSHKDVTCERCHKRVVDNTHQYGGYYEYSTNVDKDCSYCHTDIHLGQFKDKKCSSCHVDTKWEDLKNFDHDKKYVLDGKHKELDCESCHKTIVIDKKSVVNYKIKKKSCIDCHDEYHR